MKIIKRNGEISTFYSDKIVNAITMAMDETEVGIDFPLALKIANEIEDEAEAMDDVTTVEEIQDAVERALSHYGRFDVAKRYIIYREERAKARNRGWELTDLPKDIYEGKYRYGTETEDEFFFRVSGGNSEVEKIIRAKDFLFAGRILAGRGINRNVTLSNCYVLPQPEDNLESIFDTAKFSARTYSYGGGVGFDISKLRPKGSKVNNSALTTSGAVSFMELYSTTTGLIGQKGRRGALMISMDVDHADIVDFVNVKRDLDKVTFANISVRFNNNFFNSMDDFKNKDILKEIATSNWQSGEPGALFWDRVEGWHLLEFHPYYKLYSTNPCGEQPLPEFGSCLLGSINLSNFVVYPYTNSAYIDYERLKKVTRTSVIALNEVLDDGMELHPLKEQQEVARQFRQIGLGIMGLSDMFIKMGIEYGSADSLHVSECLGKLIQRESITQSVLLADKYGTYPQFDLETLVQSHYFKSLDEDIQDLIIGTGMRNSHVLSIAPTGSISTMLGISGGIEPIFATNYTRTTKSLIGDKDVDYKVYTPVVGELIEELNITDSQLPSFVVTSHEIDPLKRVKLQGVWQKYVDSAISSTINLNEDATVSDIEEIYFEAWKHGLKGVTIFRNNCLRKGILTTPKEEEPEVEPEEGCST